MKQAFSPLNRIPVYYAVADIPRASAFAVRENASYRKRIFVVAGLLFVQACLNDIAHRWSISSSRLRRLFRSRQYHHLLMIFPNT